MRGLVVLLYALVNAGAHLVVFDVTKYGAKGDGKTYDTKAVRAAAADLAEHGGGTLLFPPGTYLTGAFNLSSNTLMFLEKNATVKGSDRGEDWPLIEPLKWYGGGSDQQSSGNLMHQALTLSVKPNPHRNPHPNANTNTNPHPHPHPHPTPDPNPNPALA